MDINSIKLQFSAEHFFVFCLAISPLFLLTVAGWMTHILLLCVMLAIYVLCKNKLSPVVNSKNQAFVKLLCITLTLPFLGTLLAQVFRGQYVWAYYDSPTHVMLCALVLLAILKLNIKSSTRIVELLSLSFPVVTLLALENILLHPNLFWGASRLSTQAIDPLAFGSLSLTFGLLSLISVKLHSQQSTILTLYKLTGFCVGLYLSVVSGSRTGWLALPIIGLLWVYFDHAKFTFISKIVATLGILVLVTSSYFVSVNVHQGVDTTFKEALLYKWNAPSSAPNLNNSVGARVSFARMAVFLLQQKPLSGWGDGSFSSIIDDPALGFAMHETKMTALTAGFHNEITANMVRSGIWGLISSVLLFMIPAWFFMRNIRTGEANQRNVAFMALAFLICQFVSSLSMELLNLRYAASFYGLMLAIFCGQILFYIAKNDNALI